MTMNADRSGRLVILTGPSCVGKTPLYKSLGKFHPELHAKLSKLVLVNSRTPRPGEIDGVDYHFRTRSQVEKLRTDHRYLVIEARDNYKRWISTSSTDCFNGATFFLEGNPYVGMALQTHPRLAPVNRLSIFISPLSKNEIAYLKAPEHNLSLDEFIPMSCGESCCAGPSVKRGFCRARDLENVETRASKAYRELQVAWHFQYVIPNHDGEDSDHWEAFYYVIGDARKTLSAFVALLGGSEPPGVEKWQQDFLL